MLLSLTDVYDTERHGPLDRRGFNQSYLVGCSTLWIRHGLLLILDGPVHTLWFPRVALIQDKWREWDTLEIVKGSTTAYTEDPGRCGFTVIGQGFCGVIFGLNRNMGFSMVPYQ